MRKSGNGRRQAEQQAMRMARFYNEDGTLRETPLPSFGALRHQVNHNGSGSTHAFHAQRNPDLFDASHVVYVTYVATSNRGFFLAKDFKKMTPRQVKRAQNPTLDSMLAKT